MERTLLHIGEVAQLLGTTPKAIRHYHKIGLLQEPERTRAGYRLYTAADLLRVQRIRRLQGLGLSLQQIKVVLGAPQHELTLREVLQALDKELAAQIRVLEERRARIRDVLQIDATDTLAHLERDTPAFRYIKEMLGEQLPPSVMEQEAELYSYISNFNWTPDQQQALQQAAQDFVQYFVAHPEEYRQLVALGERFAAIATLPENAPEVEQLIEDFLHHLQSHPIWSDMQARFPSLGNPFDHVFLELMNPIYTPAQRHVLQEFGRRMTRSSGEQSGQEQSERRE